MMYVQVLTNESHIVLQFHYTKWPEYGMPKVTTPLLDFLRAVHTSTPPDAGPIVVHCSAGVGRSGIILTIDYCLAQMKADHVIDVRGFVSRMREHRNYMVQTEVRGHFTLTHALSLRLEMTEIITILPYNSLSFSHTHIHRCSIHSSTMRYWTPSHISPSQSSLTATSTSNRRTRRHHYLLHHPHVEVWTWPDKMRKMFKTMYQEVSDLMTYMCVVICIAVACTGECTVG